MPGMPDTTIEINDSVLESASGLASNYNQASRLFSQPLIGVKRSSTKLTLSLAWLQCGMRFEPKTIRFTYENLSLWPYFIGR